MADKKAPPKSTHPAEPVIVMFFVASLLGAILWRIEAFFGKHPSLWNFFHTLWLFLQGEATLAELINATGSPWIFTVIFVLKIASFIFSAILAWAIISTYRKYMKVYGEMHKPLHPPKEIVYGVAQTAEKYVNPKWAKVLEHVNSQNPADWKLAILEADIILDQMLDKMGYHGATMGDKLKSIEPSDFTNLQEAWEAHKVRNSIAHQGSDYEVSKPEAERVIRLFKKVFEEFEFI